MLFSLKDVILFSDNYIDGIALLELKEDFTEFKQMVPQSGLHLKLKGIIARGPSMIQVGYLFVSILLVHC